MSVVKYTMSVVIIHFYLTGVILSYFGVAVDDVDGVLSNIILMQMLISNLVKCFFS